MEGRNGWQDTRQDSGVEVVGGLVSGREGGRVVSAPGSQCWSTRFSPDGTKLAWSCGYRKVVILPWTFDRFSTAWRPTDEPKISIDAGFPVTTLAFGICYPEKTGLKRDYWLRFDRSSDVILATGHANGRIRIWDTRNGKLLLELTDHTKPVTDLAFAPDGSLRLASASRDGTIKVWDMSDDGNMFKTLKEHKSAILSIAWSPDAKLLCSAGEKQKVLVWDMITYQLLRRLVGHFNSVLSCCFSPDGAVLATGSADTRVILWDPYTGEEIGVYDHVSPAPRVIYMSGSNGSAVRGVTFSPNNTHFATVCDDRKLRLFELGRASQSAVSEGTMTSPNDSMLSCTYSPQGSVVCVGHESGSVMFYSSPVTLPSLLHLCRLAVRKAYTNSHTLSLLPLPPSLLPFLSYR